MPVFSFKNKSKDGVKQASASASDEQPKSTYRHVPTHAASDSMGSSSLAQFKPRDPSTASPRQRMSFSSIDGSLTGASLNGAAYTRAIAYNMAHRTPSPGSPYNFNRRSINPITRSISEEVLTMESDPQLHPSSAFVKSRRAGPLRSHSDWPLHRSTQSSPLILAPKPADDSDLPTFLDSGYVSREQSTGETSRAPSEQNSNASERNCAEDHNSAPDEATFVDATQYVPVAGSTSHEASAALAELEARKEGVVAYEPVSARDSGVSMSTRHSQAVAPSELRAAISAQTPRSGEIPVFDQSEIFMPPFTLSALSKSQQGLSSVSPSSRELGADGNRLTPQDLRRPVRPMSDRSLTDLSRAYARPTMEPVPENQVPEDEPEVSNKELFSYKGAVPLDDSLQQSVRLRNSSPGASQRTASLVPTAVSSASVVPKSVQFTSGPPSLTRRATASNVNMPPQLRPALVTRGSHASQRRSPLSSHEATPNGSDSGADVGAIDDNSFSAYANHSRSASVRTSRSTATMGGKPRTYFSHTGRVTVDPNDQTTVQSLQSKGIETSSVTVVEAKADKKKRFSLSFSRSQKA